MPGKPRIAFAVAIYHVLNCGNYRQEEKAATVSDRFNSCCVNTHERGTARGQAYALGVGS